MKKISLIVYVLGLALLFSACQNEQQHAQSEIATQEKLIEKDSDPEAVGQLIQQYLAYTGNFPEDAEANPRYLYRAAALLYRLHNFDGARTNLEKAIREYYDNENTANCVLLLGEIFQEKLKNKMAASILYQSAANSFPALAKEAPVAAMANGGHPPVHQRLETFGQAMYQDTSGRIDLRLANDFITGCTVYSLISPDGEKVPELLYMAGETARTVQAFGKAIEIYDWLIEGHPNFEKMPQALFLKGFTLDNDLKRVEEARAVYESFLAKYPQDDFADDAQFLLDNLGKTDEEIISSFGDQQEEQ